MKFETAEHRSREQAAADRLDRYWFGNVEPTDEFAYFDRMLTTTGGEPCAVVEIKCRTYPTVFFVKNGYLLSVRKLRRLQAVAEHASRGARRTVRPLVMVAAADADFFVAAWKEPQRIEQRPVDDRPTNGAGVVLEPCAIFEPVTFVPAAGLRLALR